NVGDQVGLMGGSATVDGNGYVGLNASNETLTLTSDGATVGVVSNASGEMITASNATIYLNSNDSVTVNGSGNTIIANGTGDTIIVNGNGDNIYASNATINGASGTATVDGTYDTGYGTINWQGDFTGDYWWGPCGFLIPVGVDLPFDPLVLSTDRQGIQLV